MGRCHTALLTALLGLAMAATAARAQPVDLDLADLDQITGGASQPTMPLFERSTFDRRTFITSSISMPIANAFAVCFMCSGDAMAVAIAGAFGGDARADAGSFASGFGQAFSRADAVAPPFVFLLPNSFAPPTARARE
jgi:hypothetical protein